MYIKKIIIKNFRSIKHQGFECAKFNVFIGKNNHGKSNVFEALDYFFNNTNAGSKDDINLLKHKDLQGCDIEMELIFYEIEDFIENIKPDTHKTSFQSSMTKIDDVFTGNVMKCVKKNKEPIKIYINETEVVEEKKAGKKVSDEVDSVEKKVGKNNIFNGIFEYIDARQHAEKEDKPSAKNNIGRLLNDTIKKMTDDILNKDEEFRKFKEQFEQFTKDKSLPFIQGIQNDMNKYLQEVFPDCEVKFNITPKTFEDLFKDISMKANDGVETKIDEKGDGVQRAVVVSIIRYISEKISQKNIIFAIDEAELHLHFETQRKMEESLKTISQNGGQVFINTHSPVFMANEVDKVIFKVEKESNETKIEPSTEFNQILYKILGGMPSDYLFPNNFLIVEGYSEEILCNNLIERFYTDKPKIQIIRAEGDGDLKNQKSTVENIAKVLYDNGNGVYANKFVILMDKSTDGKETKEPLNKIGDRLNVLTEKGLEDYYPSQWKPNQKLSGSEKKALAKKVSDEITQDVFESEMSIIFNALQKCWGEATETTKQNVV